MTARCPRARVTVEPEVFRRLDARVAKDLERLVGELRLEGEHEPRGRLAGRVGDDVELDRLGRVVHGRRLPARGRLCF